MASLAPGATVAAEHLGIRGELVEIAGSSATVRAGSVTVRVPVSALRPAAAASGAVAEPGRRGAAPGSTRQGPQWGMGGARVAGRSSGAPDAPVRSVGPELLLLGQTTDEARDRVEQYLDDAFLAGLASVRLVHGKGTGALRKTVRELLAGHPLVESFRDGEPSEGGTGATVAALKVG
jgi:DNA mismatch repair protein MutS2